MCHRMHDKLYKKMPCNHPLKAFFTGSLTENGKDDYFISRQLGDLCPVESAEKKGHFVTASAPLVSIGGHVFLKDPVLIPCGKCVGCRLDFAKQWSTRCVLEMAYHPFNYFVTLTYNDGCCPSWLCKKDLQGFLKRLRNFLGYGEKDRIRFFACGEYGEHTFRPHYHLILFCDKPLALEAKGINEFLSPVVSKAWPFGFHTVSFAEPGCCAYVAGYVVKKASLDLDRFLVKPFLLMSRKPGIGFAYLADHDLVSTLKVYGSFGSKCSFRGVPRYFKNKLGDLWKDQKERLRLNAERTSILQGSMVGTQNENDKGFCLDAIYKEALAAKKERNKYL